MREYVVDYLLCNYDSHARNFIVDKNGIVRGVDKEQAFRYINAEKSEDPKFSTNFNARYNELPSIYSVLFEKIENGEIPARVLNYLDLYVEKIDKYPEEEYKKIFEKYVLALSPDNPEKLMQAILKRKNNLKDVVKSLKVELQKEMATTKQEEDIGYIVEDMFRRISTSEKLGLYLRNIGQAINYSIILRSNRDVEKVLEMQNSDEKIEFLERKVAEKLGIGEEEFIEREEEILMYMYEKYFKEGYVAVPMSLNQTKEIGEYFDTSIPSWNIEEIMEIQNLYKKYEIDSPFGYKENYESRDLKERIKFWHYNENKSDLMENITKYPSWLASISGLGYKNISRENSRAYENRDYETALENVKRAIKVMSKEDQNKVLEFFQKAWEVYGNSKPNIALVSRKYVVNYVTPKEMDKKYLKEIMRLSLVGCDINLKTGRYKTIRDYNELIDYMKIPSEDVASIDCSMIHRTKQIPRTRNGKIEGTLNFGLHDAVHITDYGNIYGYSNRYCLKLDYPNLEKAKEVSEKIWNIVNKYKPGEVMVLCNDIYGNAVTNKTDYFGRVYFKKEMMAEVLGELANQFPEFSLVDNQKKDIQEEIMQLVEQCRGVDTNLRRKALDLIKELNKEPEKTTQKLGDDLNDRD